MARPAKNKPKDDAVSAPEFDPFATFFTDYDPEAVVVTLARLSPDEWQGENIRGYICKISPGHDEEWIKTNHGGGKYLLTKKDTKTGRIQDSRTIIIAGNPKRPGAPSPRPEPEGDGDVVARESRSEPVNIDIGGVEVPFDGDLGRMKDMILFVKAVQAAFPPPPDYNTQLLELALRRNEGPSTLEIVKELKEAAGLFGGGGSGGSTVYDLLRSVADQAGGVIRNLTTPQLRSPIKPPAGRLYGSTPGLQPAIKQEPPGGDTSSPRDEKGGDETTAQPTTKEFVMGEREIVLAVANQVVKSYRLSPPKEPENVVRMVDQLIQQSDKDVRSALDIKYRELIFDFCETELEADWSDPESSVGDRTAFADWFKRVFEHYSDPERQVVLI